MAHFLHYNPSTGTISFWARLGVSVFDGVVDAGGLDITWPESKIYSAVDTGRVTMDAGSDTCADDATNYLIWSSGTALTLQTTAPTPQEVLVSTITTVAGDITDITDAALIKRSLHVSEPPEPLGAGSIWKITDDNPPNPIWNRNVGDFVNDCKIGNDGFIYAVSAFTGIPNIFKLTSNGAVVWSQTIADNMLAIDADSSGNVYVGGERTGGKTVWKFDSNGNLLTSYDSTGDCHAILTNDTHVYIGVFGDWIRQLDTALNLNWTASAGPKTVRGMAFNSGGNIIAAGIGVGGDDVAEYNDSGVLQDSADTATLLCYDVAVDSNDNIYVATSGILGSDTVFKYNSSFVLQWSDDYAPAEMFGIAVDGNDDIYAVGQGSGASNNCFKIDVLGNLLASWRTSTGNYNGADAQGDAIYIGGVLDDDFVT